MNDREMRGLLRAQAIISGAYRDERLFPRNIHDNERRELLMFIVTYAWVTYVEGVTGDERWDRLAKVMGLDNGRFWAIIRNDLPRYVPPKRPPGCVAPPPRTTFKITDATTGRWRFVSYCAPRHQALADAAARAEQDLHQAGTVPRPAPNTGGVLPCHLRLNWANIYKQANPDWEPPELGIRADEWPVMEKVAAAQPPKLKVVSGGGSGGGLPAPVLTVVDGND